MFLSWISAIALLSTLIAIPGMASERRYVDKSAPAGGDGTSWTQAYSELRDALLDPAVLQGDVTSIWVAAGTYTPAPPNGDIAVPFVLPDVRLFGGFAGHETEAHQRNWTQNVTILSGDLNGDDAPDFMNRGDNSLRVVYHLHGSHESWLDGFVIEGGNARVQTHPGEAVGAGLHAQGSHLLVANCTFRDNQARYGGGISALNGSLRLLNCSFLDNYAESAGAGVRAYKNRLSVWDCHFEGNVSQRAAGLELTEAPSSLVMTNSVFIDNHATLNGGAAAWAYADEVLVEDCSFANNRSRDGAGAVLRGDAGTISDIQVLNCTFLENRMEVGSELGAGLMVSANRVLVSDSRFENNGSDGGDAGQGGGLYASTPNADPIGIDVVRCQFIGNDSGDGGGACIVTDTTPRVVASRFLNNRARRGGGLWAHRATVTNCWFVGNRATLSGGGLSMASVGAGLLQNSTVAFNESATVPAGVSYAILFDMTVQNSILWGNVTPGATGSDAQIWNSHTAPVVTYSCVEGWSSGGVGNIASDPIFLDPLGPDGIAGTEDDDLRLGPASPAVDSGNNALLPLDELDLDGDGDTAELLPIDLAGGPRRVDDPDVPDTGEGTAPIVDMGAYERRECGYVTVFCTTSPNSVGAGALLRHTGSAVISAADLVLRASSLPPGQFGVVYYGPNAVQLPFGEGQRCVGAGGVGLFRFSPMQADANGLFEMTLDYDAPPASGGAGAILGGSDWRFQCWYRDPQGGGSGFNLSDALRIVFCP